MTALPTARPAYGLEGPSAGPTVDNATPQGSTYLTANSVQSNGAGSDDRASPERYRVLRRVFEDVAETDPKPRTLLDWREVAKREGLRYHEWIDEYVQAQIEELPADAGSKDEALEVGAGGAANDALHVLKKATTAKPATQEEIIKAFPIKGGWGDKLKKAPSGVYQWLDGTWAHVGSQKPGDATTYYPVKVALAIAASKPQRMTLAACDLVIKMNFSEWWGEWETESEILRKI